MKGGRIARLLAPRPWDGRGKAKGTRGHHNPGSGSSAGSRLNDHSHHASPRRGRLPWGCGGPSGAGRLGGDIRGAARRLTCGLGAGGVRDGVHLQPVLGRVQGAGLTGSQNRSHGQRLGMVTGGGRGGSQQFGPCCSVLQMQRAFHAVHGRRSEPPYESWATALPKSRGRRRLLCCAL